jgi:hypothetical protein
MDPVSERDITITLPFGMIQALVKAKPVLAMFHDDSAIREVIRIIDAIHAGAVEFIRQEETELLSYLAGDDRINESFPVDDFEDSEEPDK